MGKPVAGLTALAAVNFALAASSAASYASLFRLVGARGPAPGHAEIRSSAAAVYVVIAVGVLCAILLVVSGVGYLRRHRLWGRTMGNAYALLAMAHSVAVLAALPWGFGTATVIGLSYPPVTLWLLNRSLRSAFS